MRYLLIDRVCRLECDKQIVALKNVSLAEDVYADHFAGFPVMPGALLIECAAQAGTILIEASGQFEKKALLGMVEYAKFRAMVRPGDQLSIVVTVESAEQEHVRTQTTVRVGDRTVMDARLTFIVKDAAAFYSPQIRHFVETIYDFWLKDAELIGFKNKLPRREHE